MITSFAPRPTIDRILSAFFTAECDGKKGLTLQRVELVEHLLREHLEANGERVLVTSDVMLLRQEREFDPDGAFTRTMHADDLVFALPGFLAASADLDPLDRRVQLRMVDRLIGSMLVNRLIDRDELICPLLDARYAIDSGRADLRHPSLRER